MCLRSLALPVELSQDLSGPQVPNIIWYIKDVPALTRPACGVIPRFKWPSGSWHWCRVDWEYWLVRCVWPRVRRASAKGVLKSYGLLTCICLLSQLKVCLRATDCWPAFASSDSAKLITCVCQLCLSGVFGCVILSNQSGLRNQRSGHRNQRTGLRNQRAFASPSLWECKIKTGISFACT